MEQSTILSWIVFIPLIGMSLMISIWSAIVLMNCLAEAHRFVSAWQGFGTYFNAVLVFLLGLLILATPFIILIVSFAGLAS